MKAIDTPRYIVAGSRPWNRAIFETELSHLPGNWEFASSPQELSVLLSKARQPRYVFFLHWSDRVPDDWLSRFECVCFHMTDVPYGRGGSPLQNLIVRGHKDTMLTALRMVHEMDAGPVYMKAPLALGGSAQEIFERASRISASMIARMIAENPEPVAQSGEVVAFKRRRPSESRLPESLPDLAAVHDFVRMLDAKGYPHAFIEYGGFRLEFTGSALTNDSLRAEVRITRTPPSPTA